MVKPHHNPLHQTGALISITNDFKRAVLNAEAKLDAKKTGKSQHKEKSSKRGGITGTDKNNIINSLKKDLEKATAEFNEVKLTIEKVARECRPRRYVQNRKSMITHRVAVGFEEAGLKARTLCGWKFAKADVIMHAGPPTIRKQTCDMCLPALRATLQ